jgi:hypothetical protein
VIKVFEDFDIALVGLYESVLEAEGIATFMKNRFLTGGTGEIPFVEAVPQLWVLNDADAARAVSILVELHGSRGPQQEIPEPVEAEEKAEIGCRMYRAEAEK